MSREEGAVFTKKKPSNNRVYCCVPQCTSRSASNRDLAFHNFPKKESAKVRVTNLFGSEEVIECREMWIRKLKMEKACTNTMKVCSLHFTKDDYFYKGKHSEKKKLKKNTIPTQHLPLTPSHGSIRSSNTNNRTLAREERRRRLDFNKTRREIADMQSKIDNTTLHVQDNNNNKITSFEKNEEVDWQVNTPVNTEISTEIETLESASISNEVKVSVEKEDTRDVYISKEMQEKHLNALRMLQKNIRTIDVGIQVNTESFLCFITTDATLNTFTGIPTLKILNDLSIILEKVSSRTRKDRLTSKEKILMMFMKIKHDLSYLMLAHLFRIVSRQSVARIFKEMVVLLSKIFCPLINWPSREEINDNMPLCFKKFSKTRIILDCTEVSIERPKCLKCRLRTYSQYKSTFTIKWLTGVSPAGHITYVSPGYAGRASDKFIFEQSGLLKKMIGGIDAIMVDKGFLIEAECASCNIDLIRPPFLRSKKQFSREEAELSRGIAAARVHIERANQRIKIFKMLRNRFPWALVGYSNNIFIIACAMVNLSNPILVADKF